MPDAERDAGRYPVPDPTGRTNGTHAPGCMRNTGHPGPCDLPPAETKADYLLDGSPEAVAIVREARGLPPLDTSDLPPAEHRTFHCDRCGQPAMNIDANGLCRSCRVTPPGS